MVSYSTIGQLPYLDEISVIRDGRVNAHRQCVSAMEVCLVYSVVLLFSNTVLHITIFTEETLFLPPFVLPVPLKPYRTISPNVQYINQCVIVKFKRFLFYNDNETSYTTYINHARWHRCLRSDGLRVGGNRMVVIVTSTIYLVHLLLENLLNGNYRLTPDANSSVLTPSN